MGLPLFVTISIIILKLFIYQKKQLTFIQNSIIFMMMTIVTTNYLTTVTLNFKWLKTTQDPFFNIGFLLYRDVIIPLIILIFINAYLKATTFKNKLFHFVMFLIYLQGIEILTTLFKLIEYVKWNFFFTTIINFIFLLIGIGLAKIVFVLGQKGSKTW